MEPCFCSSLPTQLKSTFRCRACVNNIVEDKNILVRENYALRAELEETKVTLEAMVSEYKWLVKQ